MAGRLRMEDLFLVLRFLKRGAAGAVAVSAFSIATVKVRPSGEAVDQRR